VEGFFGGVGGEGGTILDDRRGLTQLIEADQLSGQGAEDGGNLAELSGIGGSDQDALWMAGGGHSVNSCERGISTRKEYCT
jgi:hypothetical protein